MLDKFSKQKPALMKSRNDYIGIRWSQLYELEKEWGEKAVRYLLLTNSGGAIATLSFLGTSEETANLIGAKIALFLFVLGIFLVGVSTAKTFHHMSSLFKAWKNNVDRFYGDEISWNDIIADDKRRAVVKWWDYAIPYASLACFILGCISGAISLFG